MWAYNHRAKKFGDNVSGETIKAIEFYKEWLADSGLPCVFGGDFNLFFDSLLDCSGGNPTLKKLSIAKLMQILDKLDLIDIFRVRFPELKQFTFHRKNPLIRRRLDYLFTSNAMQELVDRIKILPSYMSDHSPIFMSVNLIPKSERGSYGWKFNNSLLADEKFLSDIRKHFDSVKEEIEGFSTESIL